MAVVQITDHQGEALVPAVDVDKDEIITIQTKTVAFSVIYLFFFFGWEGGVL